MSPITEPLPDVAPPRVDPNRPPATDTATVDTPESTPSATPSPPAARLPSGYEGLRALQAEFRRYQAAAFPHRPPRFFALELAGETGELANLEKKVWKGRKIADADFQDEAADVCIALLNFANSRGIDLAAAVRYKMIRIDRQRRARPESADPHDEAPAKATGHDGP